MARKTRVETQAETRAQLVKTARQLFFDDGYRPTSLEKVADAAGYSKGAVYSNFPNKDELCTAVLDEVRAERFGEVVAILARPDTPARIEALRDCGGTRSCAPSWPGASTLSSKCSPLLWNPPTLPFSRCRVVKPPPSFSRSVSGSDCSVRSTARCRSPSLSTPSGS